MLIFRYFDHFAPLALENAYKLCSVSCALSCLVWILKRLTLRGFALETSTTATNCQTSLGLRGICICSAFLGLVCIMLLLFIERMHSPHCDCRDSFVAATTQAPLNYKTVYHLDHVSKDTALGRMKCIKIIIEHWLLEAP